MAGAALLVASLGSVSSVEAAPSAGVVRYRDGVQAAATPTCSSPAVSYFGGPIIQNPVILAISWNSNVNATLQANIGQFYADVTVSTYWPWLHEYDTVGLAGGSEQAVLSGTLGGNFVLTPSVCPSTVTGTCRLTDAQLQVEIVNQIAAGKLPSPTLDCTGNTSTIYALAFPANVLLAGPSGSGTSCASDGFCAYHGTTVFGPKSQPIVYSVLMDTFTGGCAAGCGVNATGLENATETASHELVETITDPDVGLVTGSFFAAPAGWGDNNNGCGEVADICDSGGPGDTITVSGRSWVVQEIWSNKQNKCVSSGPTSPVCAGETVSGCRRCSCGDDGKACGGSTAVCETSSANALFGACEACTAESVTCGLGGTCRQSTDVTQDDTCAAVARAPALGPGGPVLAFLLAFAGARGRRRRAAP